MFRKFAPIEKKILVQILSKQGVEVSATFFESPKREEIRNFWDCITSLVFGPHFVLRENKSVQDAVYAGHARETRSSSALQLQSGDQVCHYKTPFIS